MANDLIQDGELCLFGPVGFYDIFEETGFTSLDVRRALQQMDGDIVVRLNSAGGSASEGVAIYNAIKGFDGSVTLFVEAIAASAAGLIALAGDTVTMKPGAMMMVHDPTKQTTGNAEDHKRSLSQLEQIATAVTTIYTTETGLPDETIRAMMKAETWLTATEAVEQGFADDEIAAGGVTMSLPWFDYGQFSNLPKEISLQLTPQGGDGSRRPQMQAPHGVAPKPKEPVMAKSNDKPNGKPVGEETVKPEAGPTPEMTAKPTKATAAPDAGGSLQAVTAEIGRLGVSLDFTAAQVVELQAKHTTIEAAQREMLEMVSMERTGGDRPSPTPGPATIERDEVDTRRAGMTAALVAQMTGNAPVDDRGLPFMNMSLVDMAALSVGRANEPRRTHAQRDALLSAGFHTTSDFPEIFGDSINRVLQNRYINEVPTYRSIARQRNFADFREHTMVKAGDFPRLQKVGEGGEIKHGTFSESAEKASVVPYAIQFAITRQMMVNDNLGAISEIIGDQGGEVADFEERTFYEFFGSAKLADGKAIFHADHNNLAGSGAAITVASVGAARAAIRKQKSLDGRPIRVQPTILLVGPDKQLEAQQLVTNVTPNETGRVNPFSGTLTVVSPSYLSGNAWYLLSAPSANSNYVWGYLNGYEAPRLRMEDHFGQQGVGVSLEHDFGVGAMDFRAGYKNPGA
ncbi:MAG: head maturation protease, ClpP-related [Pseudomonadota bacterium]